MLNLMSHFARPPANPWWARVVGGISCASGMATTTRLSCDTNQARGLAEFAIEFMASASGTGARCGDSELKILSGPVAPSKVVRERTIAFFVDSVVAGASALALKTNAPNILRQEALSNYTVSSQHRGCSVLGSLSSGQYVMPEKAIAANVSAVREWDTNGTVFGFNPSIPGHDKGEFGHNDFYPVAVAAAQIGNLDGKACLLGMILLDEIRGRLCETFSLKSYKIDHVLHGAIASVVTYGAMLGATPDQIESAVGMFVAHHVPWRAIRAGKQLSDSKGASAAISTEAAILCMQRSMCGFRGPRDIFRNPEALFRQFEPTEDNKSPFDLVLSHSGDDFSVMGMHFKLGIYEHQSAGAIQAVLNLLRGSEQKASTMLLTDPVGSIKRIVVTAYEPAFGIIGDPAKRNPRTRQSADHSMVFILARVLAKAHQAYVSGHVGAERDGLECEELWWEETMLMPEDYGKVALDCSMTRDLMEKIEFRHDPAFDSAYPDGIPTSVKIEIASTTLESGFVLYPGGHARNVTLDEERVLLHKARKFAQLGIEGGDDKIERVLARLENIENLTPKDMLHIYDFEIADGSQID